MNVIEYGKQNIEVALLLHGGGLSWWNYRDAAEILSEDFHVVLPVLDGHGDEKFTSIQDNAARILSYIDENFGGQVAVLGGLSLGGQVALEMLAQRPDICRSALIESALAKPPKLTRALIGPTFSMSYGLIKQRWFARIIQWEFADFAVDTHLENLMKAQRILEDRGSIDGTIHRFMLVARKGCD